MLYKKSPTQISQHISLLKEYYHVSSTKDLFDALVTDLFVSLFLRSGSGLLSSVIKGFIGRFFIKSGYPLLIGKRTRIVHPSHMKFGHHVWIRDDVVLFANGKLTINDNTVVGERSILWTNGMGLTIGKNVGIGINCYIAQLGGPISIGDNVLIADGVRMYSLGHKFEDTAIPILLQGYEESTITVKDNVWIGSGAVIFKNVTIGEGSVIGAHAVVTTDVPPYVVFGGIPGRVLRKLKKK